MSVTGNIGNKGNRRHTTSDSGNKVPNPKLQLLVTLVTKVTGATLPVIVVTMVTSRDATSYPKAG